MRWGTSSKRASSSRARFIESGGRVSGAPAIRAREEFACPTFLTPPSSPPADSLEQMLEGLACPLCGRHDPGTCDRQVVEGKLRILCDGCGGFVTFVLTDEQARAIAAHRA